MVTDIVLLDEETRKKLANDYALTFVGVINYNETNGKVRRNDAYKFTLRGIYSGLKDADIARKDEVHNLYSYYSKYDHVSHWTGQSQGIPIDNRKHKVKFGIMLCMMHLRDLLAIAYDNGENNDALLPLMEDLNKHMETTFLLE
ncbi:hypothetical protein GCM10022209_26450 [Chitinophaga oryziterrae]